MPIESYDIVGSYNDQRVSSIDAERTLNLFEYIDPLGKKPKSLINTSGLINTQTGFPGATNGFRAQFVFNNVEYVVIGNAVYSININGSVSMLGTINFDVGYVGIDANTFQVIFVDGQNGWIFDTKTGKFLVITDPSFPPNPIDVTYLDGFFVVANGGTNNFQLSSFNQGLIWGADFTSGTGNAFVATSGGSPNLVLSTGTTANYQVGTPIIFNGSGTLPVGSPAISFGVIYFVQSVVSTSTFTISLTNGGPAITFSTTGTAPIFVSNNGQLQQGSITSHPGNIVACRTLHRRLFLFSEFYIEVWENAGLGTNLPFRRSNSLLIEYGTPAIGSISVGFDIMIFLSQSRDGLGSVMQVVGAQAIAISNRALDFQLAQYAAQQQITDCNGFLIKENGIIFYRMNFTAANHTYVYDVTLSDPTKEEGKLWHEEDVLNGNRHPAQTHAYFNGINYVGHYSLPILYQLDSQTFTNDGEAIHRMRIGKAIVPPTYQRLRIDRFQLDLLQGQFFQGTFSTDQDLAAETGDLLMTESGDDILLEQGFIQPLIGVTPYAFLSISKDGGQTYGYYQRAPMGTTGSRTFRTLWRKLGTIPRGQAFVPKIEFYDPIPIVILGASWFFEVMPE